MRTLDDRYKSLFGDGNPTPTNLTCPLTGDRLMAEPVEREVRDPSHFYFAEHNPKYRYERHPFSWSLFRQVNGGTRHYGSRPLSWWKLEDDDSWTSMVYVNELDEVVKWDTPEDEIKVLIKEKERERRMSEASFRDAMSFFPIIKSIAGTSISNDIVPVMPMQSPKGKINYIDVEYVTNPIKITYPYTITKENIEELRSIWNLQKYKMFDKFGDLQIGDVIDIWSHGGALSLREGECVVRDGIEIYSRLTKMS